MSRQLALDFAAAPRFGRDDFLESASNRVALAMLDSWPNWPGPVLLLVGPSGSGKSHLAALWAHDTDAVVTGPALAPTLWDVRGRCVVMEDCDRQPLAEASLFHALNMARETTGFLLLTARKPPDVWGIKTPDLLSRLRSAYSANLGAPDAPLVQAVLVKLFDDRQLKVDVDVIQYAARHLDQSLDAVNRFVDAVDGAALTSNRRITRQLAATTIATTFRDE